MNILFLAGREIEYARNEVILRALRRLGKVDVVAERGRAKSLVMRSLRIALKSFPKLLRRNYNLVYVGFYGHLLMLPAGLLSRRPVVFDAFVSNYDTLVVDRKKISTNSLIGKLSLWLDRSACNLANHVLLDTAAHRDYFIQSFGVHPDRISAIPVGCNEDIFFPRPNQGDSTKTIILYYSTYLPLHGVETVVRAANILKSEPVHFLLVGEGQEFQRIRSLSQELNLERVTFLPFIPAVDLPEVVAGSDICLGGHFGESEKAGRVIPGKIYQMLAMAKPVIATCTEANQELLVHGESAYLCSTGDPSALAAAIMSLHQDQGLRTKIARGGRQRYERDCSEAVITKRLKEIISHIVQR